MGPATDRTFGGVDVGVREYTAGMTALGGTYPEGSAGTPCGAIGDAPAGIIVSGTP